MTEIVTKEIVTPLGLLNLGVFENKLCLCDWAEQDVRSKVLSRVKQFFNTEIKAGNHELIDVAESQLNEYFNGERRVFDVPMIMAGTEFQQKVWNELLSIDYGQTVSYLTLSKRLGDVKAIRAVGTANGANAISIFIPCHRVIGTNGELTGYAGGITAKKGLLELEGSISQLEIF